MLIDAATRLAEAYELSRDRRMMLAGYRDVVSLLDKQPDGGRHGLRGSALEGEGVALVELHRSAEAIAPLREAIDVDIKDGSVLDDQRISASATLGRALLDLRKPHEARVLLEPILRTVIENPALIPQRRASVELRLAQALWDDGGSQERARALALADDAERDYLAAFERLKASPAGFKAVIQQRIDEVHAWRKLRDHP